MNKNAVIAIESLAALKALPQPSELIVCVMLGHDAAGDGGSGVYWWNAADASADDRGTVIELNAGGLGRFNKLF